MASSKRRQPWYQAFFARDYLDHWGADSIPEERTRKETDFVADVLGLQPVAAYGSFDGDDFARQSHRMIVVAERPATA